MISSEKEQVEFVKPVDLKMKQVEDWMADVENCMVLTMKNKLLESIKEYTQMDRNEWIVNHPG